MTGRDAPQETLAPALDDDTAAGGHGWRSNMVSAAVAGIGFVAVLPLTALAGAFVYADVGAPLLFRQTRVGQSAKPIVLTKLRTMSNERGADGALLPDEARLKRIGRWVRRLRVDEIPQLLAIVRGDLAFVGPRPLLPQTVAAFGSLGRHRCRVRPGLTGWAQVSGNTRLTDDEKLALDIWYVDHRSARLDTQIIFETVRTILLGESIRPRRIEDARRYVSARYGISLKEEST
ncbi:MAG: sugar transferase [Pseudomonadota bacterium]